MKAAQRKKEDVSVAGKVVTIRHATEWDLDTIRNERIVGGVEMPEIDPARIVVAVEEDRIIGFGVVGQATAEGAVCVTVFEKEDRRGIGASIVRHAVEHSELATVPGAGNGQPAPLPHVIISNRRSRRTSTQGWTSSACTVSAGRPGAARRTRNTWTPAGRSKSVQ